MKYDKKGFTLVELIVVIAIMAVLAGVVSGATVGILNKKTDEVNLHIQREANFCTNRFVGAGSR